MVNLLKNEEDTPTSVEVYSVSYTYEYRIQEDITQATWTAGMALRNRFKELIEILQLN